MLCEYFYLYSVWLNMLEVNVIFRWIKLVVGFVEVLLEEEDDDLDYFEIE